MANSAPISLNSHDPAFNEIGHFFASHGYGRFDAASFATQFRHPSYQAVMIEAGATIGALLFRLAGGEGEIIEIAVAPPYRRQNVARLMMDSCIKTAQEAEVERLILEVAETNMPARQFYENYGFQPIGKRQAYYRTAAGTKIDAIIMELWLSKA